MFETEKSRIRRLLREEVRNGIDLAGISEDIQELGKKIERLNYSEKSAKPERGVFDDALISIRQGDVEGTLRSIRMMQAMKDEDEKEILNWAAALRKEIIRQKNDEAWKKCLKALFDMHNVVEFSYDQYVDVYRYRLPIIQASSLLQHYVRRRRMRQIEKFRNDGLHTISRVGKSLPVWWVLLVLILNTD